MSENMKHSMKEEFLLAIKGTNDLSSRVSTIQELLKDKEMSADMVNTGIREAATHDQPQVVKSLCKDRRITEKNFNFAFEMMCDVYKEIRQNPKSSTLAYLAPYTDVITAMDKDSRLSKEMKERYKGVIKEADEAKRKLLLKNISLDRDL